MYERFFNFKSKPFAMSPDPSFMFRSRQHAAALTMLEFAIESQAAFCLLTGEIGSGKTTLLRHFLRMLGDDVTVGLISNTHGRFRSIHPWALSALGVVPADDSDIAQYEALVDFVVREYAKGHRTLLILDEAQNLSIRVLEELRLLSNVNSEQDLALQILLVGQPELRDKLERPELRQFAQRISVDFHLESLTQIDANAYVRHRLAVAGGDPGTFDDEAIALIHARSRGVPRLMNQLCDLSLVYAFAESCHRVTRALVEQVLAERSRGRSMPMFLPAEPGEPPARPAAQALQNP